MERLFIECVRKHPCLWKTDMEDYKLCEVKDEAWRKVIEESEISENGIKTVKEAKYYWKKLRDMHRQSLSRQRKDKGAKKWKHEDQMTFLLPYFRRSNDKNTSVESDYNVLDDIEEIELHHDESGSSTPKQPRKTENIFVNTFNTEDSNSNIMARNPMFDDRRMIDRSPRRALESFFASMCEMTSGLPEYIQIRVERKIFDVVMAAREENLQNQSYFGS